MSISSYKYFFHSAYLELEGLVFEMKDRYATGSSHELGRTRSTIRTSGDVWFPVSLCKWRAWRARSGQLIACSERGRTGPNPLQAWHFCLAKCTFEGLATLFCCWFYISYVEAIAGRLEAIAIIWIL